MIIISVFSYCSNLTNFFRINLAVVLRPNGRQTLSHKFEMVFIFLSLKVFSYKNYDLFTEFWLILGNSYSYCLKFYLSSNTFNWNDIYFSVRIPKYFVFHFKKISVIKITIFQNSDLFYEITILTVWNCFSLDFYRILFL